MINPPCVDAELPSEVGWEAEAEESSPVECGSESVRVAGVALSERSESGAEGESKSDSCGGLSSSTGPFISLSEDDNDGREFGGDLDPATGEEGGTRDGGGPMERNRGRDAIRAVRNRDRRVDQSVLSHRVSRDQGWGILCDADSLEGISQSDLGDKIIRRITRPHGRARPVRLLSQICSDHGYVL